MLEWLNAALAITCIVTCACRLGSRMSKDTTKSVIRFQYVIWLGLETFVLLHGPVTALNIVTSSAVLCHLIGTLPQWRHGTPAHALK